MGQKNTITRRWARRATAPGIDEFSRTQTWGVTNATNKLYRVSNADVYNQGGLLYATTLYGEPRMYGLRLKYRFGGE